MSSPKSPRTAPPPRKSRKPGDSDFQQQRLRAWQPVATPKNVIITFFTLSLVFIPFGIAIVVTSNKIVETDPIHYEDCDHGPGCVKTFEVKEKMKAPIYMYYQLSNFHQNHRRYVTSRSDYQLRGEIVSSQTYVDWCTPLIKPDGAKSTASEYYNPCGLMPYSWFNDTIELSTLDNTKIALDNKDISWKSDRDAKFKQPKNYKGIPPKGYNRDPTEFKDFENEDFIVWMRTAGLPTFKKLYRKIHTDLEPGKYVLSIDSHFEVKSFEGKKAIVLSTTDWIGGKNYFLGWAYIGMSIMFFCFGVFFLVLSVVKKRQLGDESLLNWTVPS